MNKIKPFFVGCCANPYPTAYDESLSYYEEVCKIAAKLNEVIHSQNNLQTSFEQILSWVQSQLKDYTIQQLKEWLNDGTLENLINEALFNKKISFYDTVASMIADNELTTNNTVLTNGYYAINDGGDCQYKIVQNKENESCISLNNGLYAMPILDEINVKKLGAHGDGETDDLSVFNLAINLATNGQVIKIPSANYYLSNTLTISKPITIEGETVQDDRQNDITLKGSVLLFTCNTATDTAINISVNGVILKGLSIINNSENNQFIKNGVTLTEYIGDIIWNVTLENLVVAGFTAYGVYGENVLLSQFRNLYITQVPTGFAIMGTTSTSCLIERVWCYRCTSIGFRFNTLTYSTLLDCACDGLISYAYFITGCFSLSLINCACELSSLNPIYIKNTTGINIMGFRAYGCNTNTTNATSYCQLFNSKGIMQSCTETGSREASTYSVSIDNTSSLTLIECQFEHNNNLPNLNGDLKSILAPLPKSGINYAGQFVSIQNSGATAYSLPGDSTQTWLYCILLKSNGNIYSSITQGGTQIAPSSCYGFAWRLS